MCKFSVDLAFIKIPDRQTVILHENRQTVILHENSEKGETTYQRDYVDFVKTVNG